MTTHIAVLDDESDITALLGTYLARQGFRVSRLHCGRELMTLMAADAPQLVLLDLGLPGEDGFAVARQLREHFRCGLIIVSGRGDAVDKVVGLEVGADDYVTKPFDLRELLARIKAVLRRMEPASAPTAPVAAAEAEVNAPSAPGDARERYRVGRLEIEVAARRVRCDGAELALTGGEFDLLCVFVRHPGRVLSRDFLLGQTRGREAAPFDRTIDVQVGRLRRKLEGAGGTLQFIKSVRGAGYLFAPEVSRS